MYRMTRGPITTKEMEENSYKYAHMPGVVMPIEIPNDMCTNDMILEIQNRVSEALAATHPELQNLEPSREDVMQEWTFYFRTLYPFVSPDKIKFRIVDGIVKDTVEKYFQIREMNQNYKGSLVEVNVDRIRRRMPKKPVAYADIS